MSLLYPENLPVGARYKLLTGSVVPRFIAWISTISPRGISNLAPFSYATIVGHAPMALLFVVAGRKPTGEPKDTLRNARPPEEGGTGEFVVHVVDEASSTAMARSAIPLAFEQSEIEALGLATERGTRVSALRLVDASVAFECRTRQIAAVGVSSVVIGEVVAIHTRDGLMDERFRVDPDRLDAIGRMAGSAYVRTRDRFILDDEAFFPRDK